jgi:signal transduction histidine kinase
MLRFLLRCYLLSLLTIVCAAITVFAQEKGVRATMPPVSSKDSAAIIGTLTASATIQYTDPARAWAMVDSAMELSRARDFGYGIGNSYIAYAIYSMDKGEYHVADSLLKLAYPYCYLSGIYARSNILLCLWYENAGHLKAYMGAYYLSVAFSYRALDALSRYPADSSQKSARIRIYNSIGSMLQYTGQPDKAIRYLSQGMTMAMAAKDTYNLSQIYVNLGSAFNRKKQPEKALHYFRKAIQGSKATNNTYVLQVAHLGMAIAGMDLKQYDSAVRYVQQALAISDKTNPFMSKVTPYVLLSKAYLRKEDFIKAEAYARKALEQATKIGSAYNIREAQGVLADAYHGLSRWQQAYEHQFIYTRLNDSILNASNSLSINHLEVKYRVSEKDKQLMQQQLSISQQQIALKEKNFWIGGISVGLLLLGAFFVSLRRNYRNKQKILAGEAEINRLTAIMEGEEKERTRIAGELHDGVMSQLLAVKLNLTTTLQQGIGRLLEYGDFRQSLFCLQEAMQELRSTAHNLAPAPLRKGGLVVALQEFCERMNQSEPSTSVSFRHYGESTPTNNALSLSIFRIVQELVQNALKHACAQHILVQVNTDEELLGITVQDDGHGFATDETSQGMGLAGLRERVKAFDGHMDISSNAEGTSIYLEFKNLP